MDFEYKISTRSWGQLTDEQLFAFCQENRNLRFERTREGEIIIMSPTGGETGNRNIKIAARLELWNEEARLGISFDSSTGFILPNGAMRSPDVAWIILNRWQALSEEEKEKFPPLCPDFVIELRSKTDSLKILQKKMQEWIENGCRLAWLMDVQDQKVYIYRPGKKVETLDSFNTKLSGGQILPGFELDLNILK
ncbi:Uma2 family endonuclease [Rhodocytophaga rosea]|uniref:Uma2 family endonuclease n=1 Tax=Rhodocytophaga rosea TaxID=2704465 RepID=A0A6C0GM17_9BACT|nr:Uma2 family endonuclease [Rhodocytophaga rosea]QHT68662.1 Uma2 family endonuclease [Rhodocytophaga rosea]